jgi:hypothetical protein
MKMTQQFGIILAAVALCAPPAGAVMAQQLPATDRGTRAIIAEALRTMPPALTAEGALRAVEEQDPGSTAPDRLRRFDTIAGAIRPPREPSDALDREREVRRAQPRSPLGLTDILDAARAGSEGAQLLEELKKRGATIGATPATGLNRLSWLNPFRVTEAWASDKASFRWTPEAGLAYHGANLLGCCGSVMAYLQPGAHPFGGAHRRDLPAVQVVRPFIAPGIYAIVLRAYQNGSHFHYDGPRALPFSQTAWDLRGQPAGWETFVVFFQVENAINAVVPFEFFNKSGWATVHEVLLLQL